MKVTAAVRKQVRIRANQACEYCGVTETDAGGSLTIDHIFPRLKGGTDALDNLVYCCHQCNLYKADYWPEGTNDIPLWNPRLEPASVHYVELADGHLHPLTPVGEFTITRLRLNRKTLIDHRLEKYASTEIRILLKQNNEILQVLAELQMQVEHLQELRRVKQQRVRISLKYLLSDDDRWH